MRNAITKVLLLTVLNLALLASGLGGIAYHSAALADEPDTTPEPVSTITITAPPAVTPEPVKRPRAIVHDYQLGTDAVSAVARGMWGLNTMDEKAGFACLVINRTQCGLTRADGKPMFGAGVLGVVEKPGEFDFYRDDAPVTDQNYDYAEFYLNAQLTYLLTKQYTGVIFPSNLLYCGWENGELCFYTEVGAEPWKMK